MQSLKVSSPLFSNSLTWHAAGASDVGCVRQTNEDRFVLDEIWNLFMVADGMGGHVAGEIAAQKAIELLPVALKELLEEQSDTEDVDNDPAATLGKALERVSELIFSLSHECLDWEGMGTTVVALWLHDDQALIAHLGDSRAYLWRDNLQPLTRDHSLIELLVESGDISSEEALAHPLRHQITRYCGMENTPFADVVSRPLRAGDTFLLLSDGISGELSDGEITRELEEDATPQALLKAATAKGARDNCTVIIIKIGDNPGVGKPEVPASQPRGEFGGLHAASQN